MRIIGLDSFSMTVVNGLLGRCWVDLQAVDWEPDMPSRRTTLCSQDPPKWQNIWFRRFCSHLMNDWHATCF